MTQQQIVARAREAAQQFRENKGQWDGQAKFLARANGVDFWVTDSGLVFDHYRIEGTGDSANRVGNVVGVQFVGAAPTVFVGEKPGRMRATFHSDPKSDPISDVRSYREAYVHSLYEGIDLRNYLEGGRPRYDLVVAPGADPSGIRMKFRGVDGVRVNDKAELELNTSLGTINHGKLVAYQLEKGRRSPVPVRFDIRADGTVGFDVGRHDPNKPLVIDPLVYGSYYGGEDGHDEIRGIVADEDGGVYLTGSTQASRFPTIFGPYSFELNGIKDAFVSKFQGDAYSHDYAAFLGGRRREVGAFIDIDPFKNVWVSGTTDSADFPGNTRPNVQFLNWVSGAKPTGGTFTMSYEGREEQTSPPIPWNASATVMQLRLNATPGISGVTVRSIPREVPQGDPTPPGNLPWGEMRIEMPNSLPGTWVVDNRGMRGGYKVVQRPVNQGQQLSAGETAPTAGTFTLSFMGDTTGPLDWNADPATIEAALGGLPSIGAGNVAVYPVTDGQTAPATPYIILLNTTADADLITVDNGGLTGQYLLNGLSRQEIVEFQSRPSGGVFWISFQDEFTAAIPWNATVEQVEAALEALPSIGEGNVRCIDGGPGFNQAGGPLPETSIVVTFCGELVGTQEPLEILLGGLQPIPIYGITTYGDQFLIRFSQDLTRVLNPLPTRASFIGGDRDETVVGMKIIPNDNPAPNDPVEIVFAGNTTEGNPLPELGGHVPMETDGFILRYTFDGANLTLVDGRYISGNESRNLISQLAVDRAGQAYVAGTVYYGSQVDTSQFAAFMTTGNVFPGGRLLRRNDAFVRKYDRNGTILYSALIGGNGDDSGAGVAVDNAGNAYVTGIAGSFNFPRTPGAYGENFSATPVVFVTKINLDASQIFYSTHLRTTPPVQVSGIAVDNAGNAYVAGIATFTLTFPVPPPNPNEPNGASFGSVPTTGDALRGTYTSPATPELPTDDGYLLVLNANGSNLVYGTYVGAFLDEYVWAPYTDRLGDVWVYGYSDSWRQYSRGTRTYTTTATLAEAFLSPFAFKRNGDQQGPQGISGVLYGLRESPFTSPATINTTNRRDGFLIKLRLGLPTIANLTITPNAVAGGLGASTTGTLTLTNPAPAGGLDIVLTLDNTAASFSSSGFQDTMVLNFPGGQQTATFQVFTEPVTQPTNVNVRATLEGNFMNRVLTVQPWLSQLTLSPNAIVGGNQVTGRVRLFQTAITDVVVNVSTDNGSLISFPAGETVTVPAGQDTATFLIDTGGVGAQTVANVTVTLLGVGKSQPITVTPTNLVSVTFNPTRVTGGTASTGTVTLDGKAGTAFTVNLSINAGTAGYTITPSTITFNPGDTSKSFTVQTAYEPVDTQRKITATRPAQGGYSAQSRTGTLFIDASDLIAFTIDKTSVNVGENATGTVSLSKAAGQGGAVVNLSASNSLVTVPATVVIPAGDTSASFPITTTTQAVIGDQSVMITAQRGAVAISRTLTVKSSPLTVSVSPSSVVGGDPSTGTVSLGANVPSNVVVNLTSSDPAATVPGSVTILAGNSQATFPITTTVVNTNVNVTIGASTGTLSASTTLQVRSVGVMGISFSPPKVRGSGTSIMRITLDSPAPAGGVTVNVSSSNPLVIQSPAMPTAVTIAAGQTFIDVTVVTRRVSRTLATLVTATRGNTSVSAVLTASR